MQSDELGKTSTVSPNMCDDKGHSTLNTAELLPDISDWAIHDQWHDRWRGEDLGCYVRLGLGKWFSIS
jgi:hypothetical protein